MAVTQTYMIWCIRVGCVCCTHTFVWVGMHMYCMCWCMNYFFFLFWFICTVCEVRLLSLKCASPGVSSLLRETYNKKTKTFDFIQFVKIISFKNITYRLKNTLTVSVVQQQLKYSGMIKNLCWISVAIIVVSMWVQHSWSWDAWTHSQASL